MEETNQMEASNSQEPRLQTGKDHVFEVNKQFLISMQQKIRETPCLLRRSAGRISCCIFRVPAILAETKNKAYEPQVVSVGPYHHGRDHLQVIEEHKWRFLSSLLSRTEDNGLRLEDYFNAIGSMEERTRQSYSEHIKFDSHKFIELMVLDGCFIIEVFRIVEGLVPLEEDDPIFRMPWIIPTLMMDLIKLENQIPFFVLQCLYDLSKQETDPTLSMLTLQFFNLALKRPRESIESSHDLNSMHLLDLLRSSLLPIRKNLPGKTSSSSLNVIHSATKLFQAGIRFKGGKSGSVLGINFRDGVIDIPTISINDFTCSLLLNCIAFEQCHGSQITHISTYTAFLCVLISIPNDVALLQQSGVIQNCYGRDEEVAQFFNDLRKNTALDIEEHCLSKLFEDVNEYCKRARRVEWSSFKQATPWWFIAALAAVFLLIFTMAETFFSGSV